MSVKKRGLGRGLSDLGVQELLSDLNSEVASDANNVNGELRKLPLDKLQPGKYQPRQVLDSSTLQELADSIAAQGIIQPIVVRPITEDHYEIIAGERRWRAAQLAKLTEAPVVVREISDKAAMAVALIENIQREDLNAIEQAQAFHRLIEEFEMTHDEMAKAVGKSRASISNTLRLLHLPADVKALLQDGKLEMGHARALLALPSEQQGEVAKRVVIQHLSVRETEKYVRMLQPASPTTKQQAGIDPNVQTLQKQLTDKLGARVIVATTAKGKGKLIIHYNSLNELEGILEHFQ